MRKPAPSQTSAPKKECYAYVTKEDGTIRYGWFTEAEFKASGFIQINIGSFQQNSETQF